jgi:hypothetical protein
MFGRASTAALAVLCLVGAAAFAQQQTAAPATSVLFENVRIFDGKSAG